MAQGTSTPPLDTVGIGDGTSASALRVTLATDSVVPSHAVTNAGTFAVQATGTVELGTASLAALETVSITALPAGTNNIGVVELSTASLAALETISISGTVPVSGTFWQATQPVSLESVPSHAVTLASTTITGSVAVTDNSGSLTVDAPVTTPVFIRLSDGTSAISTLPVSLASVPSHAVTNAGTFAVQATGTVELGTASLAALETVSITALPAGTNNIGVVELSTASLAALETISISGTVPVSGTFWQATQPVSGTVVADLSGAGTLVDNAAFTDSTTRVVMNGYVFDDVAGTTLTENDAAAARIDAKRSQVFVLEDATTRGQRALISVAGGLGVQEIPDATVTYAPSNAQTSAYASNLVIKASAGVLFGVSGYNSKSTAQFIQIHNTTSLPADASVPIVVFRAGPLSNFSYSSDKFGKYFSTGITVCNSSTGPTKTVGSSDCWFTAEYK